MKSEKLSRILIKIIEGKSEGKVLHRKVSPRLARIRVFLRGRLRRLGIEPHFVSLPSSHFALLIPFDFKFLRN